jgi:hypothetical protein
MVMFKRTRDFLHNLLFGRRFPFTLESAGRDRLFYIEDGRRFEVIGELLMSGFVIYVDELTEVVGSGPMDERPRVKVTPLEKERIVKNIKSTARKGYYFVG